MIAAPLPRVLCIARNYPNDVLPRLGLWTERLVQSCAEFADFRVVAPVPYWPPLPGPEAYRRFRRVPFHTTRGGREVLHPRFVTGPGTWFDAVEGWSFYATVIRLVRRLRGTFPFELVHAHFGYPDGWVAAKVAERYHVPLIITEHAAWRPRFDNQPGPRRMALWAADRSAYVVAVSETVRATISDFIGDQDKLRVIPNAVDTEIFTPDSAAIGPVSNRLLFVGIMRHVKGLDLLLRALRILLDRGRHLTLAVVGESFYAAYQRDYENLLKLVTELGLDPVVEFLGGMPPHEVAEQMKKSAVLVLPSRRETFGSVLVEALACGVPVVATRCGGAEEIVNSDVGVLVPSENPEALADGITAVLDRRQCYDPSKLRAFACENYDIRTVGARYARMYSEALQRHRRER